MACVNYLCNVLQHIIDSLYDTSLAKHDFNLTNESDIVFLLSNIVILEVRPLLNGIRLKISFADTYKCCWDFYYYLVNPLADKVRKIGFVRIIRSFDKEKAETLYL